IEARNGGSILLSNLQVSLTNFSGGTLNGGTWAAYSGSTIFLGTASITTNAAEIQLDGLGSRFDAVNQLRNNRGNFLLTGGQTFSTAGDLTNSGMLKIGNGSTLKVNGTLGNSGTVNVSGSAIVNYAAG